MKKILFTIAIIMVMAFSAYAQRDGFFNNYYNDVYNDRMTDPNEIGLLMPNSTIGSNTNESAPLGSGLLIMTVLGAAYMIKKNRS
ncbi:MAG: hypothetical protein II662_03540 [Bacteroidales bacterium]|nr:hypothetical protein [Bacteroidales bacterium]